MELHLVAAVSLTMKTAKQRTYLKKTPVEGTPRDKSRRRGSSSVPNRVFGTVRGSFRVSRLASDEQEKIVFVAPPRRDRGSTAATMDPNKYVSRNRSSVFFPSISVPLVLYVDSFSPVSLFRRLNAREIAFPARLHLE